jgi:hypothetical protein
MQQQQQQVQSMAGFTRQQPTPLQQLGASASPATVPQTAVVDVARRSLDEMLDMDWPAAAEQPSRAPLHRSTSRDASPTSAPGAPGARAQCSMAPATSAVHEQPHVRHTSPGARRSASPSPSPIPMPQPLSDTRN